ncbi:S8 family serine peptidase [Lusitaniella coriacea LEGE 07157]|uniref:S8 family serine peptidase n=1 Tax=Lusitaniella coriacea LEGE 07157 TaxID=945747 RepID=A0A8J7DVD7_9CYAN|nr:S8 family serine peptidase [Lusitaniella coriacea]MBE9115730.1 S8 family serine peptidase [Lusitaniella coriacea LEGE 07157]
MTTIPSDPLFSQQWHLSNSNGLDLNVTSVWDDYTGRGVRVGVIDDGFDYLHPDLNDNYDRFNDYDYNDNDFIPFGNPRTDSHGTAVAGIIGAEAENGIGGVGVAFGATLIGFRATNIDAVANALRDAVNFDVVNNSWGYPEFFFDNFDSATFASAGQAIRNAVVNGRNGLGTAIVFAAGNDRAEGNNTNYHNFQNSRRVITVAAANADGTISGYSTPGASILVSGFGSPIRGTVVTTDRRGTDGDDPSDYRYNFNGTSAAAPMVSGVIALMLEANSNLGYRDIQEILAYSARQTDRANSGWETNGATNWNGGGLHVSHNFGFGLVDAHAAVRLAETWQSSSRWDNEYSISQSRLVNRLIPDNNATGISSTIAVGGGLDIDSVEVALNLTHPWRGNLVVTLASPDGTESVLVNRPGNRLDDGKDILFTLSSTHYWGENSAGDWTLNVRDLAGQDVGVLNSWMLNLYGDLESANDTYIYTNEFANYSDSFSRRILNDTSGVDTINAAAITSNSYLNLNPGSVNFLAGNTLSIGIGTLIENAFGGDGDDTMVGNSVANLLQGDRGDDYLQGNGGDDTLKGNTGNDVVDGGFGNDVLRGGTGNDLLMGREGNDWMIGEGETDILIGGGGSDYFTFYSPVEGIDQIVDFNGVEDWIVVSASGFGGGLVANSAIASAQFTLGSSASSFSHRFIYDFANGNLFFDQDGIGGTAQVQVAALSAGLSLNHNNIFAIA